MNFTMECHMRLQILRIFVIAMFAGPMALTADAQTATPKTATVSTGQLGASINNAGLQQSFDLSVTRRLTTSKNPWLSEAHVAAGGFLAATPAGVRGGGWVEYAPVSVMAIRAGLEPAQYFGTFHSLTSFDTRLEAFDPDARKARASAASGHTMKMFVSPTLQFRAGHLAARSTLNIERWSSSAAGPLFYEPTRDTLLAVGGDDLASISTVVLYQHSLKGGGQLMFGPMHSIMRVRRSQLNQVQKVGLVAVREMSSNHFGLIRPSLSAQAAYYVDDPNKQGQWSGAMAVGFSIGRR
jgi:hypothetical protein